MAVRQSANGGPIKHCDVLVIGAGVAGTAAAYELASAGVDVIVAERGTVCSGSSALNAGGVRQQFRNDTSVRVAQRTVELLTSFEQQFGIDPNYHQAGYLFLYGARQERMLQAAVATQNASGLQSRFVDAANLTEIVPGLDTKGLVGGVFGPTDGYLDPHSVVTGFAAGARRAGALILEDTPVGKLETQGDRIVGVRAGQHQIAPDAVVNAAGVWAPLIAAMYGGDLPIASRRQQIFILDQSPAPDRWLPLTFDLTQEPPVYFHSEGQGLLCGTEAAPLVPDRPATVSTDWNELPALARGILHRLPGLDKAQVTHGWAGLIEVTPDENPIVGWTHLTNLYTVAGFSGVGMCLAPGLAVDVAREIRGTPTTISLSDYRLERFEKGPVLPQGLWITRGSRGESGSSVEGS